MSIATFDPLLIKSAACFRRRSAGIGPARAYKSPLCLAMFALERSPFRFRPLLHVFGNCHVRDRSPRQRRLDRFIHHIDYMGWPHHSLVIGRHVHKQLVEIDILLIVGADQIVEGMASNREHRLSVTLRVVETIEQVDAARTGRPRQTQIGR